MEESVFIHPLGVTPGVVPVLPAKLPRTEKCEMVVHIGIFFDGTGNNKDWDDHDDCHIGSGSQESRRKESNVAKLFYAYPDTPASGYYPVYISGVGTPCLPIGETEPALLGMAMGEGGDGRINYGLTHVLNSIYRVAFPNSPPPISAGVARALCRNGRRTLRTNRAGEMVYSPLAKFEDGAALRSVGMETEGGLLMGADGRRSHATAFYRREIAKITEKLKAVKKPKPIEILIDVFGFSRGAAQARVFCSWLDQLFDGDSLCGVPAKIRFLGIFDTVASVGVPNNPGLTHGLTNGHMAWADIPWLKVPARVKNCVHFIAMHENRPSFPLDRVTTDVGLPPNCHEYAFPGMHSDVGGGYAPWEQGRGRTPVRENRSAGNAEKLSQIPLKYMLDAALAAKVPLKTSLAAIQQSGGDGGYDPFTVDPQLQSAYEAFHAACLPSARQPADWLLSYLAWRYQVRDRYTSMAWRKRALPEEVDDLDGANASFLADIKALDVGIWALAGSIVYESLFSFPAGIVGGESVEARRRKLAPEAGDLLRRMREHPKITDAEALIFGTYAHDSYAGFRPFDHKFKLWLVGCRDLMPGSWEPEGYIRYRRFYTGMNKALTFEVVKTESQREAEAMQSTVDIKGYGIGDVFPPGGW